MLTTAFALFLLLGALAAGFAMSRRWGWCSAGRRPHPRRWITRIICGALGGASIVLMAVGTVQDALGSDDPARMNLQVPTLPPPEPPSDRGELLQGRFLLHAVLVAWKGGSMKAIHGETVVVQWPGDQNRRYRSVLQSGSTTVEYWVEVNQIRRNGRDPFWVDGMFSVNAYGRGFSGSSSGGLEFPMSRNISRLGTGDSLFSVVRPLSDAGAILFDLTPVREEDPLKPGRMEDFFDLQRSTMWRTRLDQEAWLFEGRQRASGSPALALIGGLGGISALLLGTAIVLSQLFRRRSLGFVKVAACLILYVGALDRLALRIHQSRVRDGTAPVERRLEACANLPTTMFFRETARRDLLAAAADAAAPKVLQDLASRLVERDR